MSADVAALIKFLISPNKHLFVFIYFFFFFFQANLLIIKIKETKQTKPMGGLIKNSWISLKEAQASADKLTQKYQLINKQLIENTTN